MCEPATVSVPCARVCACVHAFMHAWVPGFGLRLLRVGRCMAAQCTMAARPACSDGTTTARWAKHCPACVPACAWPTYAAQAYACACVGSCRASLTTFLGCMPAYAGLSCVCVDLCTDMCACHWSCATWVLQLHMTMIEVVGLAQRCRSHRCVYRHV